MVDSPQFPQIFEVSIGLHSASINCSVKLCHFQANGVANIEGILDHFLFP